MLFRNSDVLAATTVEGCTGGKPGVCCDVWTSICALTAAARHITWATAIEHFRILLNPWCASRKLTQEQGLPTRTSRERRPDRRSKVIALTALPKWPGHLPKTHLSSCGIAGKSAASQ